MSIMPAPEYGRGLLYFSNSNANCPNRPSQNEYRKRAVQVRNGECGVRRAPQFDFRHRQASCASPREIMSAVKASHCFRHISQGEPCEITPAPGLPILFAVFHWASPVK